MRNTQPSLLDCNNEFKLRDIFQLGNSMIRHWVSILGRALPPNCFCENFFPGPLTSVIICKSQLKSVSFWGVGEDHTLFIAHWVLVCTCGHKHGSDSWRILLCGFVFQWQCNTVSSENWPLWSAYIESSSCVSWYHCLDTDFSLIILLSLLKTKNLCVVCACITRNWAEIHAC